MLSHTASAALNAHPRNIDDARLRKLAANGGVIQVNSVNQFLIKVAAQCRSRCRGRPLLRRSIEDGANLTAEKRRQAMQRYHDIGAQISGAAATFDDFMKHMLHILEVAGPEHVGLGADWDGGGGVSGMNRCFRSCRRSPNACSAKATARTQVKGVLGGNLLRVMRAVEAARGKPAPPASQ